MTKTIETSAIDLSQFDQIAIESQGQDLPLTFRGKDTGAILVVIGENSDSVREYELNKFKTTVKKEKYAAKQGKSDEFIDKQVDNLDLIRVEDALARVIGWKNVNGEYKKEALRPTLIKNPQWVDDILKMSAEMGKTTPEV